MQARGVSLEISFYILGNGLENSPFPNICRAQPGNVPGSSQMCFRKNSNLDLSLQVTGICHFPPFTADCFQKSSLFWDKFILNDLPWLLFDLIWGFLQPWWFCQQGFHTLRAAALSEPPQYWRTSPVCEDLGINSALPIAVGDWHRGGVIPAQFWQLISHFPPVPGVTNSLWAPFFLWVGKSN